MEQLLVAWLTADLPGVRVCTELPADFPTLVPLVQVTRIGGPHSDDLVSLMMPTMDVDAFGADRAAAAALIDAVDDSLRRRLPGRTVTGGRVGKVRTLSGAQSRTWDDQRVRRYGASYQLWVKTPTP